MYAKLAGSETGLVGYWQFDQRDATIVADVAGGDQNGRAAQWTALDDVHRPGFVR